MGCSSDSTIKTADKDNSAVKTSDSKPAKGSRNFEIVSGPSLQFYEMSEEQKKKIKKEMEEQDKNLVLSNEPEDPNKKYDWKEINEKLPVKTTKEEREKRLELWNKINEYGNGYVSFDRLSIQLTNYLQLPQVVRNKEPMKLAFDAASNKYSKYGVNPDDKVIEWMEFRVFLVYLRQYFEYWAMFESVDVSGDKKISLEEFKKALPVMEKWGVKINDAESEFKTMDTDGSGEIAFDEFCAYAIKKSLDLDQNDNFDFEKLKKIK